MQRMRLGIDGHSEGLNSTQEGRDRSRVEARGRRAVHATTTRQGKDGAGRGGSSGGGGNGDSSSSSRENTHKPRG